MTLREAVVRTESGLVRGRHHRGVLQFRGVPFAAPPVGLLRFAVAAPPEPWSGIRDATTPGPGPVQPWRRDDPWDGYLNPAVQGDDVLTLEVVTPDLGSSGLPVMVWFHGGAFATGCCAAPAHDGATFARDGVVHVSVGYRLSLDGFMLLEDALEAGADNLGLRDQVAALVWVRRNVAAFGGDPDRVTIAGQSAGGASVGHLLASPLATGLFQRAIVQSAPLATALSVDDALDEGRRFAAALGRRATRDSLRDVTPDELRAVVLAHEQEWYGRALAGEVPIDAMPFDAAVGTTSRPVDTHDAVTTGAGRHVPLLVGTTRDEASGTMDRLGLLAPEAAEVAADLLRRPELPTGVADVYRAASRPGASAGQLLVAALTDAMYRAPAIRLVEERAAASWLYEFAWQSPGLPDGVGADHVVDVPFARDDFEALRISCPAGPKVLGDDPPQSLADAMHGAFVRFVVHGDPGWAPYTRATRTTMRLDVTSEAVPDLAGAERETWARR